MILSLGAIFSLVRKSASADVQEELTGWYQAPNFRGTWELIVSCVLTLTICVWSALHLNVPTEDSRLADRNKRRARWIMLGIFVPELVVATAFGQFLAARWLMREIQKDVEYRDKHGVDPRWSREQQLRKWSFTQCYFAVMGGVRTETGDFITGSPRLNLTAEGIRLMSFLGRLPDIPKSQIKDKSKADGLAKSLVLLQASWMVIQTLARVSQHLPVTLLEINTMGHVVCAFALYTLWWNKPLEIKDPSVVLRETWMDKFVATMWMCSPICWQDPDDFISEIRCMDYTPPSERGNMLTPTAANLGDRVEGSIRGSIRAGSTREQSSKKPHKTRFSIGSIGALDPKKFIGPLEGFEVLGHDGELMYEIQEQPVATEHEVFQREVKSHYGLRHSKYYCRRALKDCSKHDPLGEPALQRWRLANELVDELWSECEKRPGYRDFFFTTSSLGLFVGELIYIADHIPNFPGLSYLGSVNVHHDLLKFVVALTGAAYGGLHLSAWNDHFPTETERWLWMGCSLATGVTAVVLGLFFLATQKIRAFENLEHFIKNNQAVKWSLASLATPAFLLARMFIVVEAFISLRKAPASIYKTPEFTNYIPHL